MSLLNLPSNDLEGWDLDKLLGSQEFIYINVNGQKRLCSNRLYARCKACFYGKIDGQNRHGGDITICTLNYNQLEYCEHYRYDKNFRKKLSKWSANWVDSVLRDMPISKRTKEVKNMDANKYNTGSNLKAKDLGEKFKGIFAIDDVTEGEFEDGKKLIVRGNVIDGKDKIIVEDTGVVLNKTNLNTLINKFGSETDDWIDQQINLITEKVDYQGDRVLALRFD